jgi:HEAT repeat protein
MGGAWGPTSVASGAKKELDFPLLRYCIIEKPGKYRITVSHDLGWWGGGEKPTATSELIFRAPNREEADKVVTVMLDWIRLSGNRVYTTQVDFQALRNPAYLESLLRFAKDGSLDAVDGIASIQTPEATKALIELLQTTQGEQLDRVTDYLSKRVPLPEFPGSDRLSSPRGTHIDAELEVRRVMMAWRPEFAQQLRTIVMKVRNPTSDSGTQLYWMQPRAPIMIAAVLQPEDAAFLTDQITLSLTSNRHGDRPHGTLQWGAGARIWIARGMHVSDKPQTLGEKALFLTAFRDRPEFRSTAPLSKVVDLIDDRLPAISEMAMGALPTPAPAAAYGPIARSLKNGDPYAGTVACQIVRRDKIESLATAVAGALHDAPNEWFLESAASALLALDQRQQTAELLAERIDSEDSEIRIAAFAKLVGLITGAPEWRYSNLDEIEAPGISKQWLTFLKTHSSEVAAGKKFKLSELADDQFLSYSRPR